MTLPRLIREFADARCLTTGEAAAVLGGMPAASNAIRYLRRREYVVPVRRGLYAFNPHATGDGPDRFVLASKVAAPCALSHHSALELHGVSHAAIFGTVYIATPRRPTPFEFGGTRFQIVHASRRILRMGTTTVRRSGQPIPVASRELALVQAADRPAYCGGTEEVLVSVQAFPSVDWDAVAALLRAYDKTALWRKVGFLAEQNAPRWQPPEPFLRLVSRHVGRGATYFGTTPGTGGRLVARWRVIVPERFLGGGEHG